LYKWKKLGRVFNPLDYANNRWLNEFAQAPATLIFDDFVRVFFSCRPKADHNGKYVSYPAYVDLKRQNLFEILNISKEPILKLGEAGTFDEFGIYPISVIRDNDKVFAYYGGWTRCESVPFNVAIGLAISHDNGESFTKVGKGPMLSYSLDEPFILSGPKIRKFDGKWYLWYISGGEWITSAGKPEPIYKIRMAISHDGINWTKHNKNVIQDKLGRNEAQASPDVIYANGKYHMFFCYRQDTDYRRNKKNSYRIGYAYSYDMLNWTRDDSKVGIDVSDEGWDSEMVAYPHVFELDGNTYMFYLGNQVGKYGFGLALLEGLL
jgi:sucrose-6-phosphate hydrolase SacC (GH32 family)